MIFLEKYIKRYAKYLWIMIITTALVSILNLITPLVFSFVIDNVISKPNMDIKYIDTIYLRDHLWVAGLFIIFINVVLCLCYFVRNRNNYVLSENIVHDIRNDLYDHIQRLPYEYHVKSKSVELIQKCTNDVDIIKRVFSNQLSEMVNSFCMALFALIILFRINSKLTLISMIAIPFLFGYAYIFFTKMQEKFLASDNADGIMVSKLQESITGIRVVKAFSNEKYEIENFYEVSKEYKNVTTKMIDLLALYWGTSDFVVYFQIVLVIVMGIFACLNNNISVGNLLVFITYEFSILFPVRNLGRILADIGKMKVSCDRLKDIMDQEVEDLESGIECDLDGDIVFDHVSFKYGNNEVLHDISLTIPKNKKVAIMGPTGCGKSTLMYLLLRLYDYDSGKISINNVDIRNINRQYLRRNIGIVLQEPFLYSKSIYDNIANHDVSRYEVEKACRIANVHDVIESFSDGYDTLVGEKGVTLSGGQKQRVAIARCIVNDLKAVIFDDSLSAVDTQTDLNIQKELKSLSPNMTKIMICQRINTAKDADMIVVMENGYIRQIGNHEQLINEDGLYQKVAAIQSQKIEGDING